MDWEYFNQLEGEGDEEFSHHAEACHGIADGSTKMTVISAGLHLDGC